MCGHRVRTVIPEACAENCLEPWEFGTATGRFYCSDCLDDQYNAELQRMQAQQQEIYQSQSIPIEEQQSRYSALLQQLDKEFLEYKAREVTASRETIPCPPLEHKGEVMDVASDLDSLSLSLTQTTTNTSRNSTASPQQLPTTLANRRDLPTDPSQQLHLSLSGLALDRGSCGVEEKFEGYPAAMPDMESEEL